VEEVTDDEESEVTPAQRRQKQPAAALRQGRQRPVDDDGDGDGDNSDEVGLDDDAAAEDGTTQGPGGSTADQLVKKMVRLALACEFSRQPIRRADISTKGESMILLRSIYWLVQPNLRLVLGPDGRRFKQVFEEAQKQLRDKFGMEMTELPIREKVTISQRRGMTSYLTTSS
jgi:melanoma-associated antigen